jgi:hypothetical protein
MFMFQRYKQGYTQQCWQTFVAHLFSYIEIQMTSAFSYTDLVNKVPQN